MSILSEVVSTLRQLDEAINPIASAIVVDNAQFPVPFADYRTIGYLKSSNEISGIMKNYLLTKKFPEEDFYLILPQHLDWTLNKMASMHSEAKPENCIIPLCLMLVWEKAQNVQKRGSVKKDDNLLLTPKEISECLNGIIERTPEAIEAQIVRHRDRSWNLFQRELLVIAKGDLVEALWQMHRSVEIEVVASQACQCGTGENTFVFLRRCRDKLFQKTAHQ